MARLKNVSGEELLLYARAGQADSFAVPPDGVVDVPGEVTADVEDAVVIGEGDDARAWPKALWKVSSGGAQVGAAQLDRKTARTQVERDAERAAQNVAESEATAAQQAARTAEQQQGE